MVSNMATHETQHSRHTACVRWRRLLTISIEAVHPFMAILTATVDVTFGPLTIASVAAIALGALSHTPNVSHTSMLMQKHVAVTRNWMPRIKYAKIREQAPGHFVKIDCRCRQSRRHHVSKEFKGRVTNTKRMERSCTFVRNAT